MTDLLESKSWKRRIQITPQEISQIEKDIAILVQQISELDLAEMRRKLRDLRFGILRYNLLHLAAKFGNEEEVALILKLANGEREIVDGRDVDSLTAMHFAAINGNPRIMQMLIENRAELNPPASEKKRRWTPIHYAAKYGNREIMELLISSGISKEEKTDFALTPLIIASEFGRAEIVEYLLANGVNINAQTSEENHRMNALHYAVLYNSPETAEVLLKAGIDKKANTNLGESALDLAAKTNNVKMAALLLEWGVGDMEVALKIADYRHAKEVSELLKKYILVKKNLFKEKWLTENEAYLARFIEQFNRDNLTEAKIAVTDDVAFNAYGILALEQSFGIFSKEEKNFAEFALEKCAYQLPQALEKLASLTATRSSPALSSLF